MATVLDIQTAIANEVDQDDSAPTQGGTDWNIRLNLINRANRDWSETYEWESLKKTFNGLVSTSSANASYQLPGDFRKLDGFVNISINGTGYDLPAVDPSKNYQYVDSDKYVNVLPNVLYIHSSTLPSGASVQFTYYSSPASLVSAGDVLQVPDSTFITQRVLYYLYKGREDGRFPEAKVEANRILARMVENEVTLGRAYVDRTVQKGGKGRTFRIGRDG